jgi:hypothetical protein
MNQTKYKFKELFTNVKKNAGKIIELQLDCVEDRMSFLSDSNRHDDMMALGKEYLEWAIAADGEEYGFLFIESIEEI